MSVQVPPPNWATGAFYQRHLHDVPRRDNTQFDRLVIRLGLQNSPECWPESAALLQFARVHKNHRYIPEWLLNAWGMTVKTDGRVID